MQFTAVLAVIKSRALQQVNRNEKKKEKKDFRKEGKVYLTYTQITATITAVVSTYVPKVDTVMYWCEKWEKRKDVQILNRWELILVSQ